MSQERRRHRRVNVGFPVKVSGTDAAGNQFEELGQTINVSTSGIKVALKANVREADTMKVSLPLPRDMRPVASVGHSFISNVKVTRVDALDALSGKRTIVARFTK